MDLGSVVVMIQRKSTTYAMSFNQFDRFQTVEITTQLRYVHKLIRNDEPMAKPTLCRWKFAMVVKMTFVQYLFFQSVQDDNKPLHE